MSYMVYDAMEPVVLLERNRVADGEGGLMSTPWEETAQFVANITLDTTMNARRGEAEGVTSVYTVTVPVNAALQIYDVFKRLSDGKIFRVTSDPLDVVTPKNSSFQFAKFTAEKWTLPA